MLAEAADELALRTEHVDLWPWMALDDHELITSAGHDSDAVWVEEVLASKCSSSAEGVLELACLAVEDFDAVRVGVDDG